MSTEVNNLKVGSHFEGHAGYSLCFNRLIHKYKTFLPWPSNMGFTCLFCNFIVALSFSKV